jgi:hypothetical protein
MANIPQIKDLSPEELHQLHNEVLKSLADKTNQPLSLGPDYDRHGSGHARNNAYKVNQLGGSANQIGRNVGQTGNTGQTGGT